MLINSARTSGRFNFPRDIAIVCGVMYVLSLVVDLPREFGIELSGINSLLSIISPTPKALYELGMSGSIAWKDGRWWTIVTANYLHSGLLHIGFNLFWLLRIGLWVRELFGAARFWIIYTLAGVCGSLVSILAGTPFFVGASGAIFGLFGALIYYGRYCGGTFGSSMFRQISILALIGLLFGFTVPGVDNWGHLGGFAGGLIVAFLVGSEEMNQQTLTHLLVAYLLLIFALVCFGLMASQFIS
jgi:rhomboid protease GluP